MPLPPQLGQLPPELQAPQQQQQPGVVPEQQQSLTPTADAMAPGVQDAVGDFITTMVRMMEEKGLNMDEAMQGGSIEDQLDVVGDSDPSQFLTEDDLIELVTKFSALPPEVQQQLEETLITELPPELVQRLRAVQKFVGARQGEQEQGVPV